MENTQIDKEIDNQIEEKPKMWSFDFVMLWQGQLVSTLGDAAYSIALGFWVLAVTGSTALMGLLMAASTLPGVIVSPFAGVWVDRSDRKKLLMAMDFIRGACIVLIAVAAYKNFLTIPMVFAAGIVLSICGAVFRPGVNSAIPDIVSKSRITNANSVFSVVSTGANMVGNVAGGFLFQLLGAPFLFLFNGLSYLFSGFSIGFMKIPTIKQENKQHFMEDLKDGFRFVWDLKGLRYMLLVVSVMNFLSFVAIVLLLPLFQKTSYLGAGKYGVAMAMFMGGAMAGYVIMAIVKTKNSDNLKIFMISCVISCACIVASVNIKFFTVMILLLFFGGLFNSFLNVILISQLQMASPQDMRGKVMSFVSMLTQGLTPFAMALGGVLGSIFPIKLIISLSFLLSFSIVLPFGLNKHFAGFLNRDFESEPVL